MDKKKKKAKRKAKAAANAGEPSGLDHSHRQHRSSERTPSLVSEENEIHPASLPGSVAPHTELRKSENDQFALGAEPLDTENPQSLEIFDRRLVDGRPDDADNNGTTDFRGGGNLNGEHFDSYTNEEQVGRVQMQALIIQMTQMQANAQEKEQAVRELKELQEALAIERETAELLRDQLTFLQGHIAERDVLEMGTHKQVQRLNTENVYLQGLVADLTEKVKKLKEELERTEEERGKLEEENSQIMLRREREEGERVAELINKVEKLEQEREDLEEKQSKLKQEGRQMIVKMEQEGEKMEHLSRQMVAKMETERQILEQEIRQMAVKMEQEQEKLEMERLQMQAKLEQERLKLDQENKQRIVHLTAEGGKLEKENRQLLVKIEQEREDFHQEINGMKAIMALERGTLEQERLQMAEELAQERKQVEFEYEQRKAKLERDQDMLVHDRQQITGKMAALDTQLEQLEREASVRDRVFKDLATATDVDSSKKWESWRVYGKDPLAEAIAVAEEARMQRMAMAHTVDKLLAENVELMGKVNEQAIMISDLTVRMNSEVKGSDEITDAEVSVHDPQEVIWRPDSEAETKDSIETHTRILLAKPEGFKHYGGRMDSYAMRGVNGYIADRSVDESVDLSASRHKEELTAPKPSHLDLIQESSAGRIRLEESTESFTTLYEITETGPGSSGPTELAKSQEELPNAPSRAPVKGSSLIKAPVRFFSFVAGYISGADLVKQ